MNVLANLRSLRQLIKKIISAMPIIFDFDNDVIAIEAVNKSRRRSIGKLLTTTSSSIKDIASAFEIPESFVLEIKSELEAKKSKK